MAIWGALWGLEPEHIFESSSFVLTFYELLFFDFLL